ncbi:putative Prestalk A differentiation protein A [Streptomyces aurantiacus JA 4570]|uniref:Putative Prestalk A differentiation protein A n=2 Tax=Streptomyces aurantiacus TaxID=47760 RepID=S3ZZ51_9ACTN|nr:putative Prestalk A differentiation protein A [Streptomyces aurantiacus JA 4570]
MLGRQLTEGMTKNTQNTTQSTRRTTENTQAAPATSEALTVLVTGATGRVGSRVAQAARAAGHEVRAASRSGAVRFDWYDPSTWADALRGADAAFLAYQPDVGAPGAADAVGAFARQAVELGVRHLVLLSARGEDQAHPTEAALAESGAARWTVVRASWFAQNFSEGPLADAMREGGELVFPGGEVLEPFIDARDIADVVLAVLAGGERYAGRILEVSGGRLLSFRDAVAEISAAAGREFGYVPVAAREYGAALTEFGVPDAEVEFLIELFETNLDGRNARVSDGVRDVLGRGPREFTDFVREAVASGTWKG